MSKGPRTVRAIIAQAYANLARAHAALGDGVDRYTSVHHAIGNRLYSGLISGTMAMRSIYDDERLKMTLPQACCYCGSRSTLSADHLLPRMTGGPDDADNLVWACRSCNCSKQGKDLLTWMFSKGRFPPILLFRRYLKLVSRYCEQHGILEVDVAEAAAADLPFSLDLLSTDFPQPAELTLWVLPADAGLDLRKLR